MSGFDLGTVYYHAGATQTGRATFKLKIQGKGAMDRCQMQESMLY